MIVKRVRRWILTYAMSVILLHEWGEKAWPWHVRDVWDIAAQTIRKAQAERLLR